MTHRFDGVVPPHAFLLRALVAFDTITGWKSDTTKLEVGASQVEGIRLERDGLARALNPTEALGRFLLHASGLGFALELVPVGWRPPEDRTRPYGTALPTWDVLREQTRRNGAVILRVDGDRHRFELYCRAGVEMWANLAGLTIAREAWLGPTFAEIWLAPSRLPSWLATQQEVSALLESLILRVGGPTSRATLSPAPHTEPAQGSFRQALVAATAPWAEWRAASLSVAFSSEPSARRPDDLLADFVATLARAQRQAPRGYVGLAHFRDRLLLPSETKATRESVLKLALDSGVARVVRLTEPQTKAVVAALELTSAHPIVQAVVSTPAPVESESEVRATAEDAEAEDQADDGGDDLPPPPPQGIEDECVEDYTEGWKHSQ